jgi:hypothetical protein
MRSLLLTLLFVGGILLAGSEGPWCPSLNVVGVLVLLLFILLVKEDKDA